MKPIVTTLLLLIGAHVDAGVPPPPAACKEIARLSNSNALGAELALAAQQAASKVPLSDDRSEALAFADFDDDGRNELLLRDAGDVEHVVDADRRPLPIARDESIDWELESQSGMHALGALELDGVPYLVFGTEMQPRLATVVRKERQQVACQFGTREGEAALASLSQFEAIGREAMEAGLGLWTYAITAPGTRRLDVLRAERAPMNDPSRRESLLTQAYSAGRGDVFAWLLKNGADANEGIDEHARVLELLLWQQDSDSAIAAIMAGAHVGQDDIEKIAELLELKRPGAPALAMQAVKSLRLIPERLLIGALVEPQLFDAILKTKLPVRPDWWEWQADERILMRPSAAEEFARYDGALEKARRAYQKTVPPARRHAAINFGTEESGWRFQLAGGDDNPVTHEELLLFATAFCVYFLPENCGSEGHQQRALKWAAELATTCADPKLAALLGVAECNTAVYYNVAVMPKSPKPMFVLPTGANWRSGKQHSIVEMYRVKRVAR